MKKKILMATIGLTLISSLALAGDLEEAKLKLDNIKLELQLLNNRAQVLRYQGRDVRAMISTLKVKAKVAAEAKAKAEKEEVEKEDVKETETKGK